MYLEEAHVASESRFSEGVPLGDRGLARGVGLWPLAVQPRVPDRQGVGPVEDGQRRASEMLPAHREEPPAVLHLDTGIGAATPAAW